jgi:hypothetical protein
VPERLDLLRDLVPEHRRTIDAAAELVPALAARSTARQLLDYLTYYELKARAGAVGEPGLRVHLVGQGFGGRLVTAASSSRPTGSLSTLTLLPVGGSYAWRPGAPHNLRADRVRARAHGRPRPGNCSRAVVGDRGQLARPGGCAPVHRWAASH